MGKSVPDMYGRLVFSDALMKEKLPADVYRAVHKTSKYGIHLQLDVANTVAAVMKEWAIEHGATHFTHWFQPMTGVTAEKHDAFISMHSRGDILMEFSGKELVKGEPDASSFPSGGLRATFEARGYTAWDPSSPAFIKDGTLYIPTAFCSYSGEALDQKTPLLRSMEALNQQAVRMLKLLGRDDITHVDAVVGSEQEYFLIDKDLYKKRRDLLLTGRTLLGARAPKGQEMEDHYFGVLKPKVSAFMHDLDHALWELGVPAKTKHNEVAPGQHELAPIYETVNIAVDHNQLTMEMMKKIADQHHFACLLHEKPFAGVNGSGKHNNWSLRTNTGENLLKPGRSPIDNIVFLIFLMAVIEGVDQYQELLRISVASAGNDHRLGANEAPPAIVSIFLGDELTQVLEAIETGTTMEMDPTAQMEAGATVLPHFTRDTMDRNRTSPFAFTGNKFEFRMPGSSLSVASPNMILNTIVAESLDGMCCALEHVEEDFEAAVYEMLRKMIKKHKRILFDGNGYADEWIKEASKRGLAQLKSLPEAVAHFMDEKNVALFKKHHVLTAVEMQSRHDIYLENYIKTIHIESLTMQDMVQRDVLPVVVRYMDQIAVELLHKKQILERCGGYEEDILRELDDYTSQIGQKLSRLSEDTKTAEAMDDLEEAASFYHDVILNDMELLRKPIDLAEALLPSNALSYPTYDALLFSVR